METTKTHIMSMGVPLWSYERDRMPPNLLWDGECCRVPMIRKADKITAHRDPKQSDLTDRIATSP